MDPLYLGYFTIRREMVRNCAEQLGTTSTDVELNINPIFIDVMATDLITPQCQ